MKIKFESDYGLTLGKILNILVCVIIAKSAFEENGEYYPQVYLKDCFFKYEHENEDDSYVCCEAPLKFARCVDYGLFLSKKVFNFFYLSIYCSVYQLFLLFFFKTYL